MTHCQNRLEKAVGKNKKLDISGKIGKSEVGKSKPKLANFLFLSYGMIHTE